MLNLGHFGQPKLAQSQQKEDENSRGYKGRSQKMHGWTDGWMSERHALHLRRLKTHFSLQANALTRG